MKTEKNMWSFHDFVQEAYEKGFSAWNEYFTNNWKTKQVNPFPPQTNEWYSWNKGWNTNQKGI